MNPSTYLWPEKTHCGQDVGCLATVEATSLRAQRAFLITDPGVAMTGLVEPVLDSCTSRGLSLVVYGEGESDPDLEGVERVGFVYFENVADLRVVPGGGSALDAAKAVRLLNAGSHDAKVGEYLLALGNLHAPSLLSGYCRGRLYPPVDIRRMPTDRKFKPS